jgi:hypothetical protein
MATVVFTDKGILPNAAGKRFVDGKTYSATIQRAIEDQWSPPPDPFKAYADEKRRQEAIARSEAAARANIPNLLMNPSSIPLLNPKIENTPVVTPSDIQNNLLDPSSIPVRGEEMGVAPVVTPFDIRENLMSPSTIPMRGEKIEDVPVVEPNVDLIDPLTTNGQVADRLNKPITYDDLIASLNLPELSADFDLELEAVKKQLYGEKKPQLMPNGEIEYFYDSQFERFHGITKKMQAAGFLAGAVLDPPGPNATEEEKAAYYESSKRGLYAPPLYKTGYEFTQFQKMTKSEKFALQKKMKNAGYYTDKESLWPGIIQQHDLEHFQAALGEANVTGLEVDDLFALRARSRKKAIAQARNGASGSGTPDRTVDISFNTTTMANGRILLSKVLQDALGRAPSDEELSQFMSMLNNAESKSPTKTITQYVRTGGTRTSTSRTNPSDVDPAALAEEFAAGIDGGAPMGAKKETDYLMGYLNSLGGAQ